MFSLESWQSGSPCRGSPSSHPTAAHTCPRGHKGGPYAHCTPDFHNASLAHNCLQVTVCSVETVRGNGPGANLLADLAGLFGGDGEVPEERDPITPFTLYGTTFVSSGCAPNPVCAEHDACALSAHILPLPYTAAAGRRHSPRPPLLPHAQASLARCTAFHGDAWIPTPQLHPLQKKFLIEQLDGEKVVARKKGFTVETCVGAVDVNQETPQFQGLPSGDKVGFAGRTCPRCRRHVPFHMRLHLGPAGTTTYLSVC